MIVVTTFDLDEYVRAAFRYGASGFVLKRSGPTLLVEAVRAAMVDGFRIPADLHGLPGWSFWGQVAVFMTWEASVALATLLYWRDTRSWAG